MTVLLAGGLLSASAQIDTTLQIGNVVVTGTRSQTDVRHLPFTVSVLGRQTLIAKQRTNILPTLTEQVPGLFVTSRGLLGYGVSTNSAGGINMRGISGGSGQLMVLIDGHPQYNGIYGHPIADSYQTMMADRVEVLRGPASMIYGSNAMGGVVNIVTRKMKEDGMRTHVNIGAGSYGTAEVEASSQMKTGRLSSTLAAQYGRTDNNRPRMGFEQYGGYAKVAYELNDHWNAFASADITHFNASNPGPISSPLYDARQWITRGAINAGIENHYGNTSGALSVYDNFGRHKINDGESDPTKPNERYFRSKDALIGVNWYQSMALFEGNRTTVGMDYQHIYGDAYYTKISTGEVLETPNKQSGRSRRNEIAGYLDFRQDILDWMTVDLGLRVDHHSISGTQWIPQGGIVVRPNGDSELRAMVSKGFRNPTMRELYLYPPSNTDLKPERLMNYELSWKQSLLQGALSYGVNLFYINADNMIETIRVDGRPRNVNSGALENTGAELELAWKVDDHWSLNTNHSVLHMHRHVLAAPSYKGYLGASWHNGPWSLTAGLQQIAGLYTQTGATETTENFTLLDLSARYQIHKNLALWVKGDNLLAQQYEIMAGFPMPKATFMGGVSINF